MFQKPLHMEYNHPQEDAFRYQVDEDSKTVIVVVADGITRDPIGATFLPTPTDPNYPKPSKATEVANIFCESLVSFLRDSPPSLKSLNQAFVRANEEIRNPNRGIDIDYLKNDFAACVGVGGVIHENLLYYGYIGDCGLAVFDRKGTLQFQTKDEGPSKEIGKQARREGKKWSDPVWRAHVRKHYRNNPSEPLSYGAFTGEETAMDFLRTGRYGIREGSTIIFYTDGVLPFMNTKTFRITRRFRDLQDHVEKNKIRLNGAEGTFVTIFPYLNNEERQYARKRE